LLDINCAGGRAELGFVELLGTITTGVPGYVQRYGRDFWADLDAEPRLRRSFDAQMNWRFDAQMNCYGRFHICGDCREEYDEHVDRCPRCRSGRRTTEDRRGRLPAMLTLTYPGDWLTVAATADTVMRHFQALCKRYARAWGEPLRGPWKKEPGHGAPHFHISTTPPMGTTVVPDPATGQPTAVDFKRWLSITWADIVAHPDPEQRQRHVAAGTSVDYAQGIKLTDPRRMAVYFAKYGAAATGKEYQHQVPREWLTTVLVCTDCGAEYDQDLDECPGCGCFEADVVEQGSVGRFWGYRGLHRELAIRQVTSEIGIAAGRIARRWYRAKGLTKRITVERVEQSTGRVTYRRSTVRKRLFAHGRGFLCVNDGSAFASQLARYLADLPTASSPPRA
jgi:RNA polymerase subunit RPABC4/transcription elongation factor Spt4